GPSPPRPARAARSSWTARGDGISRAQPGDLDFAAIRVFPLASGTPTRVRPGSRMRGVVVSSNDDLVKEFLVESYEGLDRLDSEFIALEQDPQNREHLGSIFRTIHTIKGTCGFFGF